VQVAEQLFFQRAASRAGLGNLLSKDFADPFAAPGDSRDTAREFDAGMGYHESSCG
jgi:hypothetical protein